MASPLDCEPLLEALSREIGQFEGRVAILEQKCMQIRSCIAGLVEEFHQTRGSATTPVGHEPTQERLSLTLAAEQCGLKNHVELDKDPAVMIVHEPDGGRLTVDARLGACPLDNGKLEEEIRNRLAELCREGPRVPRLLYVPVELDLKACFAGHEQLLEDAATQGVVVAPPSVLVSTLRGVAVRWLSCACGHSARAIVDKGQDLVEELSAFISDFTETEKLLCSLVDECAQTARTRAQAFASQSR